jgi:hypothetical protein
MEEERRKTQTYKSQSTMSTHTMSRNAHARRIELFLKRFEDCRGQFLRDVAVHLVALVVRRVGRIDVESSSRAEVP